MLLPLFRILIFLVVFNGLSLSHAYGETTTKILLFGDSIIAGYGLTKHDSLSLKLEKLLTEDGYDVHVINGGVSGDTTSSGRSRLAWTLEKHQPNIVLLALGGNDVLRGFSPVITQQNLDSMLALLTSYDVQLIFSRVQAPSNLGPQYKKAFDAVYSDLAAKYDIPLYPFLLDGVFGNKALMQPDHIHPNAAGSNVIAHTIKLYLHRYLSP